MRRVSIEQKIKRLEALKKAAEQAATVDEMRRVVAALIDEYLAELKDEVAEVVYV